MSDSTPILPYEVLKDRTWIPDAGGVPRLHFSGTVVDLSEQQAKYLVLAGIVAPKTVSRSKRKTPRAKDPIEPAPET